MYSELFTQIMLSIITILGAVITYVIVPYIQSKLSAQELEKLTEYITLAVRCAEQIFTQEEFRQKKEYVFAYAKDIMREKLCIELSDEQLNAIIEGLVNEVKKA